jgi:hypothetical protein
MKLKVGDKVKLKNRRGKEWNRNGKMDKYIGKIVTVSNITLGNGFTIKEDDGRGFPRWVFRLEDIEYVVKQKHFKSLPNNYTGTIEVENGFIQEKEILDDTEKRYLKAVIRPFKNRVINIIKENCCDGNCYISISLNNAEEIFLPSFKKGTMYNGMEDNKEYTLKELGLDV